MAFLTIQDFEKQLPLKVMNRGRQLDKEERISEITEFETGKWEAYIQDEGAEMEEVFAHINPKGEVRYSDCSCDSPNKPHCEHLAALLLFVRRSQSNAAAVARIETQQQASTAIVSESKATPTGYLPETIRTVEQCSELARLLVKVLAAYQDAVAPHKALELATAVSGVKLSAPEIDRVIQELVRAGLLEKAGHKQFKCPLHISRAVFYYYIKADKALMQRISKDVRQQNRFYYAWGEDMKVRSQREAFLAIIEDDASQFLSYVSAVQQWTRLDTAGLIAIWAPDDLDPYYIDCLPSGIMAELIHLRIILAMIRLDPEKEDPYRRRISALLHEMQGSDSYNLPRILCVEYLLKGDEASLEATKKLLPECDQLGMTAVQRVLAGEYDLADLLFKEWAKMTKKTNFSNVTPKVFTFFSFFQLIIGLRHRDSGLYAKLQKQSDQMEKQGGYFARMFTWLGAHLRFLQNSTTELKGLFRQKVQEGLFGWPSLLAGYWSNQQDKVLAPRIQELSTLLAATGYTWLKEEVELLIAAIEGRDWAPTPAHPAPLHAISPRVEAWENALEQLLLMVGASESAAQKSQGSRLVWLVDFEANSVQPKEQTYGKGGWLSGRNVGVQRLMSGQIECMTQQDHVIAAAYAHHVQESAYWSPSAEAVSAMWVALTGHPLLFLKKSPSVGVQFEREELRLVAQKTEKGYKITFKPELLEDQTFIYKETPTRYKLIVVEDRHLRLIKAMGGSELLIPERAESQLKQAIEGLSKIIPVQSGLIADDDPSMPVIDPDSRVCVHLLPVGNGFHVELYIRPLGSVPPYCKPGEGEAGIIGMLDGQRVKTQRNLKAEVKAAKALRDAVETLRDNRPKSGVWELEDAAQCLNLLLELDPLARSEQIVLEWPKGEKFRIQRVVGFDDFMMTVRSGSGWFEVEGKLQVDEEQVITMQELIALSQQQKSDFIELSPGKFLALTEVFRKRLKEIDSLMTTQKSGALTIHPLAIQALEPFANELKHFEFDRKFKENRERYQQAFSRSFVRPEGLQADLRPYQAEGLLWLQRCAEAGVGACLADDMGLGKTIQALGLLLDRADKGPALVVAPASVCRNWLAETQRFAPSLTPVLFGEGDRAAIIDQAGPGQLLIVTYDLMTRASEHFTAKTFATIILDEAQAIKNRGTKRSETAMQLQADFRLIMSGTPLENHLGELWNLFQFANPGLLGSLDQFNDRFAYPIERLKDDNRRDQLRRLLHPFILRRRKDEVLKDLPEKTEITLTVELSAEERAFYEALRRQALAKLAGDDSKAGEKHLRILAEIMRLRQASCHPRLADPNATIAVSAKLQLFAELVDELRENGHKALIFSQFVSHLALLREVLDKAGISYQYLDGQTPLKTRQERIEAFQAGQGDCFLISLKAGGVGLNLTAADYVIHMDPWWNPAVEDQATDRAHRIGQEKPVTVYRLVAGGTIEEKILKLHEHKRDLADSLLSGADVSTKLSADELLAMIADASF